MDTGSIWRSLVRFIATVGAGTFLGSLVAIMILLAKEPAPAELNLVKAGFLLFLMLSAPFVLAGLFLFGLPIDWALRKSGYRHAAVYGTAGALGGGIFAFLLAFPPANFWPPREYTFMIIGAVYGLITAIAFWLIFRRGRAPAA